MELAPSSTQPQLREELPPTPVVVDSSSSSAAQLDAGLGGLERRRILPRLELGGREVEA